MPPVLLGFDNSLFGKWSTASARGRGPREDLFRGIRCRSDRHCYYWVLGERAVNRPSIESPSLLPHSPSRSPPIPKLVLDLFWVGSKSRFNSASPMTRDFCPAKRVSGSSTDLPALPWSARSPPSLSLSLLSSHKTKWRGRVSGAIKRERVRAAQKETEMERDRERKGTQNGQQGRQ